MTWFILAVVLAVIVGVLALIVGVVGGGMGSPTSTLAHEPLPDERLGDDDIVDVRFDVGLRGYRMSQVDGVLDRLRRELRERDEQIAVLTAQPSPAASTSDPDERQQTHGAPEDGIVASTEANAGANTGTGAQPESEADSESDAVQESASAPPHAPS